MFRPYAMLGRLCLLAAIVLQAGCLTINLPGPLGPVKETELTGKGDGKVLLIELSGVISSQDKEGIIPQPNMLATFKEAACHVLSPRWSCGGEGSCIENISSQREEAGRYLRAA